MSILFRLVMFLLVVVWQLTDLAGIENTIIAMIWMMGFSLVVVLFTFLQQVEKYTGKKRSNTNKITSYADVTLAVAFVWTGFFGGAILSVILAILREVIWDEAEKAVATAEEEKELARIAKALQESGWKPQDK